MKAIIKRFETSDEGTFGKLFIDNKLICYTGELPVGGGNSSIHNERRVDCIPEGTYRCNYVLSPRFKKMLYRLDGVPNRDGVLIHTGNLCGNVTKGFKSDVEGCILVGTSIGTLNKQKAVLRSVVAHTELLRILNKEPFDLTIEW